MNCRKKGIAPFLRVLIIGLTLTIGYSAAQSAPAFADESSVGVSRIEIAGNSRIDSAAIRAQLKSAPPAVAQSVISEDIKALYNTGFFDQVTASVAQDSGSGRSVLRFTVVEKPVVRKVFITGNQEVKEEDLGEILKIGANRFLDKARIAALIKSAGGYYQAKGFYDATFDYSVTPVGDNQVDVTFKVNEGPSYKIRKITIRGLSQIDEDDLISELQTRRYKWYSSWLFSTGRLNREQLDTDRAIMRQYFLDHGFVDASVGDPQIEKKEDGIYLTFDVTEGKPYQIGSISASGELVNGSVSETVEGIKSEPGDTFNASQVREDTFTISEKYTDQGFAFANVVPNTNMRRDEGKIDLDFNVSRGDRITINRINIRGNEKTYDNVIRRELKVEEQQIYSSSKIKRSQELLQRLGYFEEVNISQEQTTNPNMVDLLVNVREASTGTFSVGAGFSSSDGALFSTRVSENNLFGTGQSVSLTGEFGTERDNLIASYLNPRLNDSYLSLSAQALRTNRQFSDFDRRLTGANVTLGYPLEEVFGESFEDISAAVKYEYLKINIHDVDREDAAQLVLDSEGESTSSALTPSLVRNTINNPLNPTKGSKQVLSAEFAGLGGDQEYYLFEARNQWYYPLINSEMGEFVFAWRTSFGYGDSYNDEAFPLFRRYFPGGINSVRGFKTRTLGPEDEEGNEFGGSKELINNLELIFPLVNSAGLKGVVFYDVGEAFDDEENIELGELRQAYGLGVRWTSPLGPIRIEFGFPIDRQPGERRTNPMFSFGAPF